MDTKLDAPAIASIVKLTDDAKRHKPEYLPSPFGDHRKALWDPTTRTLGEWQRPPLAYKANTPSAVSDLLRHVLAHWPLQSPRPRVFVNTQNVTAVIDDNGEREHRIVAPLTVTEQFVMLSNAVAGQGALCGAEQSDLLWTLRSTFHGAIADPLDLIGTLRELKFKRDNGGASNIRHGAESIDQSIRMELAGVKDGGLPELVTFRAQPWHESDVVVMVRCALRVHVQEQTFTIRPLDGELARARRAAVDSLSEELARTLEGVAAVFSHTTPDD